MFNQNPIVFSAVFPYYVVYFIHLLSENIIAISCYEGRQRDFGVWMVILNGSSNVNDLIRTGWRVG